jgi:hypothetical protein
MLRNIFFCYPSHYHFKYLLQKLFGNNKKKGTPLFQAFVLLIHLALMIHLLTAGKCSRAIMIALMIFNWGDFQLVFT